MTVWMKISQLKTKEEQQEKSVEIEMKEGITYEKAIELAQMFKQAAGTFTKIELRQARSEEIKGDVKQ